MPDEAITSEDTPLMGRDRRSGFRRFSMESTNSARNRSIGILRRAQKRFKSEGSPDDRLTGIDKVCAELEDSNKQSNRFFWVSVFFICNHVVGGALTLHFLEGWSLFDSAYFCIVTTTTVGYGDITPSNPVSKLYVIYYVVVSIGLISTMLAYLVGLLLDQQEELLLAVVAKENNQESEQGSEQNQDTDVEVGDEPGERTRRIMDATKGLDLTDYYGLGFAALLMMVVLIIGFLVFNRLEKLSILDSAYATVISATTVGFGDYEPTHNSTKAIMTVWLCFSTIAVGKLVADFTDASVKAKQRAVSRRLLTASMDIESLSMLDRDHDGKVGKCEFVTELLVRSGKVERAEVDAILLRFDQLDEDNSGHIDLDETS